MFKDVIFKRMLQIKFMNTPYKIARKWIPDNIFGDESTLVLWMAYLNKYLPSYLTPQKASLRHDEIMEKNRLYFIFHTK